MKRFYIFISIIAVNISAIAQSIDERIGAAMNSADYFGLYDTYYLVNKDSINPFLEVFSRCLIGNRFNRPDISIPSFDELLNTQLENLDLNLLLQSSVMFSMDLSRVGKNKEAYDLLSSILSEAYHVIDSVNLAPYANMAERYEALSKYSPYQVDIKGETGIIPFDTVTVGKARSGQCLMQIPEARINGIQAQITFDTGAGVNIITDSLARVYGLELIEANAAATGLETVVGHYAIAKELKMGNITVSDVPFYVIDVRSHNEEADKYIGALGLIVGSELMLQLKDVTINFYDKQIQVPRVAGTPSNARPNICFSSGMNFLTTAEINKQPYLMVLDTGDANHGSLNKRFFEQNKEYLTAHCQSDTIRQGGVGGTWATLCYLLPDAKLTLGNNTVIIPSISVQTEEKDTGNNTCDGCIGLRSMMLFKKLRFNLVDMVLSSEI